MSWMKTAFVGDTHGQAFHLLATALRWGEYAGYPLDLVIQVGDFGAERLDRMTRNVDVFLRWAANDPAQFDVLRTCRAGRQLSERLREVRRSLGRPVYFLRGDHDEVDWLRTLGGPTQNETMPLDPFDLFHYLPDGLVFARGGLTFAVFGGVESPEPGKEGTEHDPEALTALLGVGRGAIDVLLTHEPPYGVGRGYHGQVQGSSQVSKLIDALQPRFHLSGHLHTMRGPVAYGETTSFGLHGFGGSSRPRVRQASRTVQPGTVAVLDTDTGDLEFVIGSWLMDLGEVVEKDVEPLAAALY